MPIYAYRCSACGHAKDVLQKLSDAPLAVCPACGASAFAKQVTAAGFQLKGSGWYVTDFRDGGKAKAGDASGASGKEPGDKPADVGAAGATKPDQGAQVTNQRGDGGGAGAGADSPKSAGHAPASKGAESGVVKSPAPAAGGGASSPAPSSSPTSTPSSAPSNAGSATGRAGGAQ